MKALVLTFGCLLSLVSGDIYLHIPRGSNNRLNEASANRQNANRIFDSQNNNRGGYNAGDRDSDAAGGNIDKQYLEKFFQSGFSGKSFLTIEWTSQHGCGGSENEEPQKINCNQVLQYMCQEETVAQTDPDKIRMGTDTSTQIHTPLNSGNVNTENLQQKILRMKEVNLIRGLNEPWEWYDKCYNRERNRGLFTADQVIKSDNGQGFSSAIYTRQNPNGNRYGYECPEERDYFPYWHPSPWKDIAVLTDNITLCSMFRENSFNVVPRGECVQSYPGTSTRKHFSRWNNAVNCTGNGGLWVELSNYLEKDSSKTTQAACEKASSNSVKYVWAVPYDAADVTKKECLVALPAPACEQAPWSRSNHLGNGRDGLANTYTWQLPSFPSQKNMRCVFRVRYNISTDDYSPWTTNSSSNKNIAVGVVSPVEQNPYVSIGASAVPLRLAINTAQYGRTFEDRSHPFNLRPRPTQISQDKTLYNVNVRGKRGNIVQVYPAVEYDFAPNTLQIKEGDLVHFQWTGSNTHNNGNPGGDGQTGDAGEGKTGTDRSNVAQIRSLTENFPLPFENTTMWSNADVVWLPYSLNNSKGLSQEDLALSMISAGYYKCMKAIDCGADSVDTKAAVNNLLDNAPASYEGVVLAFRRGTYYYASTRNNNFTNRSQKATLVVT